MKDNLRNTSALTVLLWMAFTLLLVACSRGERAAPQQFPYKASVGCLAVNDFYAVYFSVYVKPTNPDDEITRKELFTPYCSEIPRTGEAYLTADLIDEDLRQTPIAVKIVEQELIGDDPGLPENFKDIRTIEQTPAQIFDKGVVTATATLDKNGFYAMYLLIGGEDAIMEEDKLRIPLIVGATPATSTSTEVKIFKSITYAIMIFLPLWFFYMIATPLVRSKHPQNGQTDTKHD